MSANDLLEGTDSGDVPAGPSCSVVKASTSIREVVPPVYLDA